MNKWLKNHLNIVLIFLVALLLFWRPLFSNLPLGLDSLGHLSKISYVHVFPFANWDMAWYSGSLFLKMYSPLFYYVVAIFPNSFFTSNFVSFLSLFLTSLGIYYLINYLTQDKKISLFCGLGFLSILSISYYWIATANLPYFSALWTIPFSLYFLEKSFKEKKANSFIYFVLIFSCAILFHILIGLLIGVFVVIRILFNGFYFNNFKRALFYGGVPVLVSSFWFIPFLFFSSSGGKYAGYVPKISQLFGLTDFVSWGFYAGGIGIFAFIGVLFLGLYFLLFSKKDKNLNLYFIFLFLTGFLLLGGLFSYYPYGVDAVRFILPFSIILLIFSGIFIHKIRLFKYKFWRVFFLIILVIGLIWNFYAISQNYSRFTYSGEDSRYGMFNSMNSQGLPLENEFSNYRFGTSRYLFGEVLNYYYPEVSQTFGYQDAGMLNAPKYYDLRWHIWVSEDIEDSIYWLDWFGIKYFEADNSEVGNKFLEDSRFSVSYNYSSEYSLLIYEYLDAKPIISLVDSLEENELGNLKDFYWERFHPDEIKIYYENSDSNDWVIFKEFYHPNWNAVELASGEKLEVQEVGPGFMGVFVGEDSKGVRFYYKKNFVEYFGIGLSVLGALFLLLILIKKSFKKYFSSCF